MLVSAPMHLEGGIASPPTFSRIASSMIPRSRVDAVFCVVRQLRARLGALTTLEPPPDLWDQVATARFSLARQETQAHLVDLLIALTASTAGHTLLTRDRDFPAIARVVPLDVELF